MSDEEIRDLDTMEGCGVAASTPQGSTGNLPLQRIARDRIEVTLLGSYYKSGPPLCSALHVCGTMKNA